MKAASIICSLFLAVSTNAFAQLRDSTDPPSSFIERSGDVVTLRQDLQLLLRTKEIISTVAGKVGDVLTFEVIRPVKAGDLTVIAKGAHATGILVTSENSKRMGRDAELEVHLKNVQLVTGQVVPIVSRVHLGGGQSDKADRAAMMGLGAVLFNSIKKGQEVKLPKGVRIPAWIEREITLPLAEIAAHQPAPTRLSADSGYIYLFMDPDPGGRLLECKFLIGEAHYFLLPSLAVQLEVPPGDYWIRTGRNAKNDNISKTKLQDFTHVIVKGGESHYITYAEDKADKRNAFIRVIPPLEGEEHIERAEVLWDYPLAGHTPDLLRKLQAQPSVR